MRLSLSFSPCPNDTFIFEPIVNKKIDLEGLEFDITLDDVENLNKAAINHIPDITKLSFNAFTSLSDHYQLLNSGSALGNNCGPLLISKQKVSLEDIPNLNIAIPGINTTAFLLLKYAFPKVQHIREMLFSDIEDAVLSGDCDAGLIIHENRFTYHLHGLTKVMDLGEYWEKETGSPIPLGGIVLRRSFNEDLKAKINRILFDSIQYAFAHPEDGMPYIRQHAQEMDEQVMRSHINLYVNEYSKDLGISGKNAVKKLFKTVHPNTESDILDELFVS
jgi:1,4-dihydroxy-6-naphthoate synthase